VQLKVKLVSREEVIVDVAGDESVEDVRDDLLHHRGRFAGDWIEVRSERNRLSRHIRYDQIVDVTAPFDDSQD
jgi:hypothetical protein